MSISSNILRQFSEAHNLGPVNETNQSKLDEFVKALRKAKFFYTPNKEQGAPHGDYRRNHSQNGVMMKHHVQVYKHESGHTYVWHNYEGKHHDDYPTNTHKRLMKMGVL